MNGAAPQDDVATPDDPAATKEPATYRKPSASFHWTWLLLSLAVVGLAMTMSIENRQQVLWPGTQIPLPETCAAKVLWRTACPGCGMTRSFISAGHGRWEEAWGYNVVGIPLFLLTVFQIPYRVWQIWRIRREQPEVELGLLAPLAFGVVLVVMLASWLERQLALWWN